MSPHTLLTNALLVATAAHAGQVDKGGQPYILHPLRVMMMVPPELRPVAVLHDVLEDAEEYHALVAGLKMPEYMREALRVLTHAKGQSYNGYIATIRTYESARIVKLADLADNLDPYRALSATTPEEAVANDRRRAKYRRAQRYLLGEA